MELKIAADAADGDKNSLFLFARTKEEKKKLMVSCSQTKTEKRNTKNSLSHVSEALGVAVLQLLWITFGFVFKSVLT